MVSMRQTLILMRHSSSQRTAFNTGSWAWADGSVNAFVAVLSLRRRKKRRRQKRKSSFTSGLADGSASGPRTRQVSTQ